MRVLLTLCLTAAIGLFLLLSLPDGPVPDDLNPRAAFAPDHRLTAVSRWKLDKIERDAAACQTFLGGMSIPLSPLPPRDDGPRCQVDPYLEVSRLSESRMKPFGTNCQTALRLALWEQNVVQPAAEAIFGASVRSMDHFGSYSCRRIAGSQRMSQHATANAIDIAGFRLDDGQHIRLIADWDAGGKRAAFLRRVRDGACRYFNVTLGPDYNAAHADHFHFDLGPWRTCR